MPVPAIRIHIPMSHLLKLAVDLGIPIYNDQVKNLYEDYYIKEALSLAPIDLPPELLRSEIEDPGSKLNKTLAIFYLYVQIREMARLEKIKIKNEIDRVKEIEEDFQQYLSDIKQEKLLKEFWKSLGNNKVDKLLKLLEQQKREEELQYLKKLLAIAGASKQLIEISDKLNKSTHNLAVVLDQRVQSAINIFEGERVTHLTSVAHETITLSQRLALEERRLVEMERMLRAAKEHHTHRADDAHKIDHLYETITRQKLTVSNYQTRTQLNKDYVNEQTSILAEQQILLRKMPQVLKAHNVDTTNIGPSGVASRAILATVIHDLRALKDKEIYAEKINRFLGIHRDDKSLDAESVIKPSKLLKQKTNEKLSAIFAIGADVEKTEVKNIKELKAQISDVQKEIDTISKAIGVDLKKKHRRDLTHGELRHKR